jgi:phenylalanyl-tRNA synthetase beta chain
VRVSLSGGLEEVHYRETYRDPAKDGADRKRILLSVELRKPDSTLTHVEADTMVKSILESCEKEVGAKLLL